MKLFFPAHRFFQVFQRVISPNWHTAVWTADSSSSCWLVGVELFFIYINIYIYIHIWVWLGWYFVWSSWKWATVTAHITGFFWGFFCCLFFVLIWADGYLLKNSFHFAEGKMHFSFGSSISSHLVCWIWENSFFGPAVCLAITIPLSKKVNKRQKKKKILHWLVSLTKHREVVWLGGAGCHVCPCL